MRGNKTESLQEPPSKTSERVSNRTSENLWEVPFCGLVFIASLYLSEVFGAQFSDWRLSETLGPVAPHRVAPSSFSTKTERKQKGGFVKARFCFFYPRSGFLGSVVPFFVPLFRSPVPSFRFFVPGF